jgi:hypothetical protein
MPPSSSGKFQVYVEAGAKKTFAAARDWPGWCRAGRDEASALQALLDAGPRYARVVSSARLGFRAPKAVSVFQVVERLPGNATTDFGAPNLAPPSDARAVDAASLRRLQAVLRACWRALKNAAAAAEGKELRRGPRGGGRDLEGVVAHVLNAEASYLRTLGKPFKLAETESQAAQLEQIQQAVLEGLAASVRGEFSQQGPRGGRRWSARTYARRSAWHILDHVWEIEDRML